jgi:hypothetical protein
VVSMHSLRPMDLLEASLRSVPAAAARKAAKTWATQRRFWGGKNDRFKGKMGTDGSGGQIWPIRRHADAHMDVADEGAQGGEVGGDRGDRKVVSTHGGDRATGVVATQRCFFVVGSYLGEKVLSPHDINMVPD